MSLGVAARLGRARGAAGQSLTAAVEELYRYARARRRAVGTAEVLALAEAWADEVTCPVRHLCVDPLDGLATLPHLRTRLAERYRDAARDGSGALDGYALVIVAWDGAGTDPMDRLSARQRAGEAVRYAFGGEIATALTATAVAALVARGSGMAVAARMLPTLLGPVRVWIEPLPGRLDDAYDLLGQLAQDLA